MTQKGLMNRKIPTALGLLILIGGLVAGVFLVNSRTSLEGKAGPTESPKNIKITNRGSGSFSISWTTDTPMTGYVKYSEDPAKVNLPAGDVRDQISGTSQNYTNHYVNITGLGPNKTYYFLIGSGSKTYNDNDKPFQTRTLASVSSPPEDVASGKVLNADGSPVNGGILFMDVEGAETLSTITKNDGTWRINLSTARSKDGKALTLDPQKTLLSIFVQAGTAGTATATTNTAKSKPVPDILMGKNQSFLENQIVLTDIANQASKSAGFALTEQELSTDISSGSVSVVTFLNPAIEGELIATTSPEFKIKLATGSGLTLAVGEQLSTEGLVQNESGEWTWSPETPLESGLNTLLVEYLDPQNKKQQVSRTFNVLSIGDASGLPAFTATPSATPTIEEPEETTTMPETDSEDLEDAGSFEQTVSVVLLGIVLMISGLYLRKRWH